MTFVRSLRRAGLETTWATVGVLSRRRGPQRGEGMPRYHVWAGPLAGYTLALPRLEKPAMLVGGYEREIVAAMQRYVRAGDVVFDVGAHVGYPALVLAKLVGAQGLVYAFEPDPANLAALKTNLHANRVGNVSAVGVAIADRPGLMRFAHYDTYSLVNHLVRPETPSEPDATVIEVETRTLDQLVYERGYRAPSFVLVDAEGAELRVLAGAERLMREQRPIVVIEVRPWYRDDLLALLARVGYRHELLDRSEADWQRLEVGDLLLLPDER